MCRLRIILQGNFFLYLFYLLPGNGELSSTIIRHRPVYRRQKSPCLKEFRQIELRRFAGQFHEIQLMETVRLFCGIQIRLLPQPFIDVFIEILFPHYIHYIEFQLPEGNQFHPHVIYFIMRLSRLQQGAERFLIAAVRQQAGSIPPSSLNVQRMNIVGHFRHPYPSQSGTGSGAHVPVHGQAPSKP